MCTVSWTREPDGYHLLANRDEKRTRAIAQPPRVRRHFGVRYLAPTDTDHGGTWIAVNEYGIAACLLNRPGLTRGVQSRGLLRP